MTESLVAPPVPAPDAASAGPGRDRSWLSRTGMSTRSQIWFAWSGVFLVVVASIGYWILAGYLPVIPASDSAEEVAAFYREDTNLIRVGILMAMTAWVPWFFLTAVTSIQMARMQPQRPVLALGQLIVGCAGGVFLTLSSIFLLIATFRPERSPELTQMINDFGWITLFITVPIFAAQALLIGVAVLRPDPPVQVYPRWYGYLNVWVATLFIPGLFIPLVKTGPVAWQGILVFWLGFTTFFVWIMAMVYVIRDAALTEAEEHRPAQA